ncbi:hypothetical protein PENTCL1PPCAC_27285, partial [Pristionchus entomophagus]
YDAKSDYENRMSRKTVHENKCYDAKSDYENRMSRKTVHENKCLPDDKLKRIARDVEMDCFLAPETHFSTHYGLIDSWEKVEMERQNIHAGRTCFSDDHWKERRGPLKKIKMDVSDLGSSDHDSFSDNEALEEREVQRRLEALKRKKRRQRRVDDDDDEADYGSEDEDGENEIFRNEYEHGRGFTLDDQGASRRLRVAMAQENSLLWEPSEFNDFIDDPIRTNDEKMSGMPISVPLPPTINPATLSAPLSPTAAAERGKEKKKGDSSC